MHSAACMRGGFASSMCFGAHANSSSLHSCSSRAHRAIVSILDSLACERSECLCSMIQFAAAQTSGCSPVLMSSHGWSMTNAAFSWTSTSTASAATGESSAPGMGTALCVPNMPLTAQAGLVWPVTRHNTESNAFARLYVTDAFTFACAIVKRARASCSSGDGASALFLLDGMPLRCF